MSSFCRSKNKLCLPLRHYTPKRLFKYAKWTKIRMYSSNFTWQGLIFAACFFGLFIISLLRVHRVEGDISEWPPKPAGSQWKGRIPSNMLLHNIKTALFPLFHLPPLSKRADKCLRFTVQSSEDDHDKALPEPFSIFHLCKSKGQMYVFVAKQAISPCLQAPPS